MKKIKVWDNVYALVDDEDYPVLSRLPWCKQVPDGYPTTLKGIRMHQLVMPKTAHSVTDHINRNKLDNRKQNLRHVGIFENAWNRYSKHGISKYKGVQWDKSHKRWKARIRNYGRSIYIGIYKTQKEAALAYDACAKILRGDYAYLNFPKEKHAVLSVKQVRRLGIS